MDFTYFTWITRIGLFPQRQTNKMSLTYLILILVTAGGTSSQIPVCKDEMRSRLSQENSYGKVGKTPWGNSKVEMTTSDHDSEEKIKSLE